MTKKEINKLKDLFETLNTAYHIIEQASIDLDADKRFIFGTPTFPTYAYEDHVHLNNGDIIDIRLKEDNDIINIKVVNQDSQSSKEKNVTDIPQGKERCGMILIKNDKSESFRCSICGKDKVSKKYAIEKGKPNIRICNSCYGWTIARLEKK